MSEQCVVFFFNDTATTEIYTLSLHDALPICRPRRRTTSCARSTCGRRRSCGNTSTRTRPSRPRAAARTTAAWRWRSEEHTSELQSRLHILCRLLLEKKKITKYRNTSHTGKRV